MKTKGFTLIELLVVLAIIGVLAGVLIVIIKPAEIFKRGRDTQRMGDLRNLSQALDAYISETSMDPTKTLILDGATNTKCVGGSATDTIFASIAYSLGNGSAPSGPSGAFEAQGTTSRAVNGTGWLPINFSSVALINLPALPLDPSNTENPSYYYTYTCKTDFSYELNARLESNNAGANDGGDFSVLYEVGPNKNLLPTTTGTRFYANW